MYCHKGYETSFLSVTVLEGIVVWCKLFCSFFHINIKSKPIADQNIVTNTLLECGFKDIAVERINVTFTFSSIEEYTQFNQSIAAPINAMLADQSPEKRRDLESCY